MAVELGTTNDHNSTITDGGDDNLAIATRDLGRDYGELSAIAGVSLSLQRGQTLAVFGANGAGKTTLLHVLATLLRPHHGKVRIFGKTLPDDAPEVRPRIGLLAHSPLLYLELSASENLRFQAQLHGIKGDRVDRLLEQVGLGRRKDEPLRTLSRGMIQRAAICRTVLHDPELLLLDEPNANLDPGGITAVEPLIGASASKTRVLISHSIDDGLAEADSVLGLSGGRQVLHADADQVDRSTLARIY
jgi:heme exporter protein A